MNDLETRLLARLRVELDEPTLTYLEAPTPIPGGYDTEVYGFRVGASRPGWQGPLILRRFGPHHEGRRAPREAIVQTTVAAQGYPAPRVLAVSADPTPLGGAFLVMERIAGRPLLAERWLGLAAALADTQARLHGLDARPLLDALQAGDARAPIGFDDFLAQLEARIARHALDGLGPALAWLRAHRPPPPERPRICHGDFHPSNILAAGGVVTGVLDWANTLVADPAYDVASTRVILGLVPVECVASPALRPLVRAARPWVLARYLAAYERHRRLDRRLLAYYEAASALRQLTRVAEARSTGRLTPLDASAFGEHAAAHFSALTGVAPTFPAAPRRSGAALPGAFERAKG